jgi:hypothetical protein
MHNVTKDVCDDMKAQPHLRGLPSLLHPTEYGNGFRVGDCGTFLMYGADELHTSVYVMFRVQEHEVIVLNSVRTDDRLLYTEIQNTARIAHWLDHCNKAVKCIDEALAHTICNTVLPDLLTGFASYMTKHCITPPVFDIRGDTKSVSLSNPLTPYSGSGFTANIYLDGAVLKSYGSVHMDASCPHDVLHHFLIALMAHTRCLTKIQ